MDRHLPVYDPKTCLAPADPHSGQLEEGMVLTVGPGMSRNAPKGCCSHFRSYFPVYALQHFYLISPFQSNYINTEVLQQYLPVVAVRIEAST